MGYIKILDIEKQNENKIIDTEIMDIIKTDLKNKYEK